MKQRIIIIATLLLSVSISLVAQTKDFTRYLNVHRGDQVDTYEIPEEVDGFQVINFAYSAGPDGTDNEFEYVDLGLPSGLRWATCNIGATEPLELGTIFSFQEIDWDLLELLAANLEVTEYLNPNLKDNALYFDPTKEDPAQKIMGGNWRMPTREDFDELAAYCSILQGWIGDVYGVSIIGPNGNTIFAPATGLYVKGHNLAEIDRAQVGAYWSRTSYEVDADSFPGFFAGTFTEEEILSEKMPYFMGMAIRAVSDPCNREATGNDGSENENQYVDLGLKSGIKWGYANLGATTPYENGKYYSWIEYGDQKYEIDGVIFRLASGSTPSVYNADNKSWAFVIRPVKVK